MSLTDTMSLLCRYTTLATTTSLDKVTNIAVSDSYSYIVAFIRLLLLFNIFLALRPKIAYLNNRDLDAMQDIPLTPSQRALVGLPPSRTTTPPDLL